LHCRQSRTAFVRTMARAACNICINMQEEI